MKKIKENWSTFAEVIVKIKVAHFFETWCRFQNTKTTLLTSWLWQLVTILENKHCTKQFARMYYAITANQTSECDSLQFYHHGYASNCEQCQTHTYLMHYRFLWFIMPEAPEKMTPSQRFVVKASVMCEILTQLFVLALWHMICIFRKIKDTWTKADWKV